MLLHKHPLFCLKTILKLSMRLMQKNCGSICEVSHSRMYERNFNYMVIHFTVIYIAYLNYLLTKLLDRYQQCKESWYTESFYFLCWVDFFFHSWIRSVASTEILTWGKKKKGRKDKNQIFLENICWWMLFCTKLDVGMKCILILEQKYCVAHKTSQARAILPSKI